MEVTVKNDRRFSPPALRIAEFIRGGVALAIFPVLSRALAASFVYLAANLAVSFHILTSFVHKKAPIDTKGAFFIYYSILQYYIIDVTILSRVFGKILEKSVISHLGGAFGHSDAVGDLGKGKSAYAFAI